MAYGTERGKGAGRTGKREGTGEEAAGQEQEAAKESQKKGGRGGKKGTKDGKDAEEADENLEPGKDEANAEDGKSGTGDPKNQEASDKNWEADMTMLVRTTDELIPKVAGNWAYPAMIRHYQPMIDAMTKVEEGHITRELAVSRSDLAFFCMVIFNYYAL